MARAAESEWRRILVVLPNCVGDVVLATPVLAAMGAQFPAARITYMLRPYVVDVVEGCGWHDELVQWPPGRGLERGLPTWRMAGRLREWNFALALLLTNSFRSGWVVWRTGARRRVGYGRDGRSWPPPGGSASGRSA